MFTSRRVKDLEPGINIHGYLFAEHGVGEEARWLVRIARQAGIDYAALPYTETFSRQAVDFTDLGTRESIYDINLICVNADTIPNFVRHVGREQLDGRYNIGMWAWEVEDLPDWMAESARYLDEIWACSSFSAGAIARSVPCPVLPLPLPITLPKPVADRRHDLGLHDTFLFLFCFDFNSIFERKNALALIAAFRRAFAPGDGAELWIKTINGTDFPQHLECLNAAALDRSDIKIVDGYLRSSEQRALMSTCDAYVSLHRAEGYGFTIAEAMALGKPVIATGYSGNMDFMTDENSYPVPFRMTSIPPGCDPYPETSRWAEPDVESAAGLMRRVFEHRDEASRRARQALEDIKQSHTPRARARFIIDRLEKIRQQVNRTGFLRSVLARFSTKSYVVTHYDVPGGKKTPRPEAKRSHRAFETLPKLLATSLDRFAEEDVAPDLVCGALDGAKLDAKGGVSVWGWAFDPGAQRPARSVILTLNQVQAPVQIAVGDKRSDVAAYFNDPSLRKSGWSFYVPPRLLSAGETVFEAYAVLEDGRFGKLSSPEGECVVLTTRKARKRERVSACASTREPAKSSF